MIVDTAKGRRAGILLLIFACRILSFQPRLPSKVFHMIYKSRAFAMNSLPKGSECLSEITTLDFPDEIWDVYVSAMTEVMESPRVLKKEKPQNMKVVQDYLISKATLSSVPSPMDLDSGNAQGVVSNQSDIFRGNYKFDKKQYNYAMRSLVYFGDYCAKNCLGIPVAISWHKMKEGGMVPQEKSVSTYMYILSGQEDDQICRDALDELATFHDLVYKPTEKTVFLRMKSLIAKDDVTGAENILFSLPDKGDGGEWKRLRTFLPILDFYCSVGDASSILRLFREMRLSPGVLLDVSTYAMILSSLSRNAFFRADAHPVEGYREAGFESSHGPWLLDDLFAEMAEDILELVESSAKQIVNALVEGFSGAADFISEGEIPTMIEEPVAPGLHIGRVEIDEMTALCPASGVKLQLFCLDEDQRQHVQTTLLEMARMSYQEFIKTRKKDENEDQDYGFQQLLRFAEWLDAREGDPFTAIVDGANVAYFGSPELHYSQVKRVVDELKLMGENPLVILPKKYTQRTFMLSHNRKLQTLRDRDYNVIESLKDKGMAYVVPPRCLDDYYWMLASVSNQTVARNKCDMQVPADNAEGRFPGLRPMLVTNDQMRDHKLELLEPREFRRWCSCHIVNYDIAPFEKNEWDDERAVHFSPADIFSREVQGNAHTNGRDMVWHFPVTGWDEPSRLCLWLDR